MDRTEARGRLHTKQMAKADHGSVVLFFYNDEFDPISMAK